MIRFSADELTNAKAKLEQLKEEQKAVTARFEQARALARQYRMKFLNLEKENHSLKAAQAEKAISQEDTSAEITKLRTELQVALAENEKLKVSFFFGIVCFL